MVNAKWNSPVLTTGEIAKMFTGAMLKGSPSIQIRGVAPLPYAQPYEASFLGNPKYRKWVPRTKAGLVLLPKDYEGEPPERTAWLIVENPNHAISELAQKFAPPPITFSAGIHPQAIVHPSATISPDAWIGPCAVIEKDVEIGSRSIIEAGVFVGQGTKIGEDCHIYPNVSIREYTIIGNRVIIHCNAVVGSDGYGYEPDLHKHHKIPQVGIVQIDDDVEIGAGTTIDRARFGKTWIQRDAKIDNLCQIAHNVVIGEGSFLMAQVGIAGSTHIGKYVALFGKVGIPGHIEIGDFAKIMGYSAPISDVPPSVEWVGFPATNRTEFFRNIAHIKRLSEYYEEINRLKKEIEQLRQQIEEKKKDK